VESRAVRRLRPARVRARGRMEEVRPDHRREAGRHRELRQQG